MAIRIGVLGAADGYYLRQLQAAGDSDPSVLVQGLTFEQLGVALGEGLCYNSLVGEVDALVVRSMPLGSLEQVIFRMDCLHALEQSGVAVVNPPRVLEVAIDKWLTLHKLHLAGLKVPRTIACQSKEAAMEAFETLGRDVLVKPLFGGEGRGIVRVDDRDMAWRVFSTLQQIRSVMYVQQFYPHLGYDIRVLFIGDDYYCMRRFAPQDSWRTNLSQGSRAETHYLSDEQKEVALRSVRTVGGNVIGVDLLPCRDGELRVLEVNAVPGWKGLGQLLRMDFARAIITHVCDSLGHRADGDSDRSDH